MDSTALAIIKPEEFKDLAECFYKSGLFGDLKSTTPGITPDMQREIGQAKAVVKIIAGREMGLPPIMAMQKLYIVEGQLFKSAQVCAALINQAPHYRYRTKVKSAEQALIDFFWREGRDEAWELVHTQAYTIEDAKRSGLAGRATYQKDPAEMLWNRCMTRGAATVAPEVIGGLPAIEDKDMETDEAEWAESIPEDIGLLADSMTETAPPEFEEPEKPKAKRTRTKKSAEKPDEPPEKPIEPAEEAPAEEPQGDISVSDLPFEEDAPTEQPEVPPSVYNKASGSILPQQKEKLRGEMESKRGTIVGIIQQFAATDPTWKDLTPGTLSEYQAAIILHMLVGGDPKDITG